jgi:hypothetical protein
MTFQIAWAILFGIWTRKRGMVGVSVALLAAATLFASLAADLCSIYPALTAVAFVPCVGSFALLVDVFSVTNSRASRRGERCFSPRLLALPVSTPSLALWPILMGALAAGLLFLLWRALVFAPLGFRFGWLWPASCVAVSLAAAQAIIWMFAQTPVRRLVMLSLMGIGMGFLACADLLLEGVFSDWRIPAQRMALPVIGLAACAMGVLAVSRHRHGATQQVPFGSRVWATWRRRLGLFTTDFSSTERALGWWEWKRTGLLLPAITIALLGVWLLINGSAAPLNKNWTAFAILSALAIPGVAALAVGILLFKFDPWAENERMPVFLAIRPRAAGDFLDAKLKNALVGAATAAALTLVVLTLAIPAWGNTRGIAEFWEEARQREPFLESFAAPLLGVLYTLFLWKLLVRQWHWLALEWRWAPRLASFGAVFALAFAAWLAREFFLDPARFIRLLSWCFRVLEFVIVGKWIVSILILVLLARRGQLSWRHLRLPLGVFLAAAAAAFALSAFFLRGIFSGWLQLALIVAASFPLSRIALTSAFLERRRAE